MRGVGIEISYQTTCRNFNQPEGGPVGPLYAMVSESKDRVGWHLEIPYFDGCRPETVQMAGSHDTIVVLTDGSGEKHEFASAQQYLRFYAASGREG